MCVSEGVRALLFHLPSDRNAGDDVCQVTLLLLSCLCSSSTPPFFLATTLVLLREQHRGSPWPRLHLGKDFTVRGHRLLLSNKQSGTGGCTDPPPCTSTPPPLPCLLISSPPIPPHLFPCSRALAAVVPCKFYMIGTSLFHPLTPRLSPVSYPLHIMFHINAQFMQ